MGRKECFQGIMLTSTDWAPLIKIGHMHIQTRESEPILYRKTSAEDGQQREPFIILLLKSGPKD